MNKKKVILGILLELVFLLVFNIVFFVLVGNEYSTVMWISYGFIHFAYVMVLLTPLLIRKSSVSSLFSMTIYGVSLVYFIIELIVGLIFIVVNPETIKGPLCLQIVIAGIYLANLILNLIANEVTADNLHSQDEEVAFIKDISSRIKMLMDTSDDKQVNKSIEKVYDLIHSSPSKSNESMRLLENDIINKISELENVVFINDKNLIIKATEEISKLMEERNQKIRLGR